MGYVASSYCSSRSTPWLRISRFAIVVTVLRVILKSLKLQLGHANPLPIDFIDTDLVVVIVTIITVVIGSTAVEAAGKLKIIVIVAVLPG